MGVQRRGSSVSRRRDRAGRWRWSGRARTDSPQMLDRLLARAPVRERRAEVPVRLRRAGIQPERLTKLRDRLVHPAAARERDAEDVVHVGRFRNDGAEVRAARDQTAVLFGQRRRTRHLRGRRRCRRCRPAPGTCRALRPAAPACRRRSTSGTRPRPAARSTIDAGTASPKSSSDRTPYSWIGRSSLTGATSRVASASVRAEPTNVPTISRTRAEIQPLQVRLNGRRLRERVRHARRDRFRCANRWRPSSSSSASAPEISTACGKHVDERANHRQRRRAPAPGRPAATG